MAVVEPAWVRRALFLALVCLLVCLIGGLERPIPLTRALPTHPARPGNGTMSRRRISVKELGQPDHQGWLYRKKESKSFLGMKWKKYWFVLKKTSFYWYNNQQVRERL